jgi:hypothetical protein
MAFKLKPNPTFRAKVGIPIPGVNADNSALLLQNYPGSIIAISRAYIGELTNARLGN